MQLVWYLFLTYVAKLIKSVTIKQLLQITGDKNAEQEHKIF